MFAARRMTTISNTAVLKRSLTNPQAQQSTAVVSSSQSGSAMARPYSSNKIILEEPSTIFQAKLPRRSTTSFDRTAMENYIHSLLF
mmetsp:Transcript_22227/g.36801  ORF Transcript_22227/g.36801 Transcript_22227/m.36801 type:complete len:86 (-) Transcript_22227:178-435(-)